MVSTKSWERQLAGGLLRHRRVVAAVIGLITAFAIVSTLKLTFESSIDIWFLDDDPDVVTYNDFLDYFEADELTVVAMMCDDVFAPEALAALDRITRAAEQAPHVHRARSLTNIEIARIIDDGIAIGPLVDELPQTTEAAEAIRKLALDNAMLSGGMVAADSKATAVLVELAREGTTFEGKIALVGALEKIIEREQRDGRRFLLTGTAPFDAVIFHLSSRDFELFGAMTLVVVVVAAFAVFRRISAALIPLSVVIMTSAWLFGLMGALGKPINIMSSGLSAVVLAVSVADSVHVLAAYYQELMAGRSREEAVEESLVKLLIPCFFTTITTAAGMLSLLVSDLQPIREFGVLAALGVVFAFLITITFVPAILALVRPPAPDFIERQQSAPIARALNWLGTPDRSRSKRILVGSSVIIVALLVGFDKLSVGANSMNYFHEDEPVRVNTIAVDEALGGSASMDFLVKAPDEGLKEPEILARLDELSRWTESRPAVSQSLSVVDAMKEIHRVLLGEEPGVLRLPESRPLAAQLYLLLESDQDFGTVVQDNYEAGRITSRVRLSGAESLLADIENVEARIARDFGGPELEVHMTGFVKLMANMEIYLLDSQIKSFMVAFLVVATLLALLLRSVRLGLFSMIPNLLPIILGVAFMGLVGIPLDPGTVVIGAIALGIVVDDTVHFMVRLRRQHAVGEDIETAIQASVTEVGRPIIITSVLLAVAFLMLILASFTPNVNFGLVAAVVILVALAADLVLLPAALVMFRPKL